MFSAAHFEVNGLRFPWGTTYSQLSSALSEHEQFKPFGGWPNVRIKGQSVMNIACTEVNIRAPFVDHPVMQVIYELTPIDSQVNGQWHIGYADKLTAILGQPSEVSDYYDTIANVDDQYKYAYVIYSVKWNFEGMQVSLSVYGGKRNNESGISGAGLYFDWRDEREAARRLRDVMMELYNNVSMSIQNAAIHKFCLQWKQQPFSKSHYGTSDPHEARHDEDLRWSQLALYKKHIIPTPEFIRERLTENDVALFHFPEQKRIFVSNRWDSVYLGDGDHDQVVFTELLPARGSGGRYLAIKQYEFQDSRESNSLLDIVQWIERLTGITATMQEYPDV